MDHPSFLLSFLQTCRLVHLSIPTMLYIFIFFWYTPSLSTPYAADIDYHKSARTSKATWVLCSCQHPVRIHWRLLCPYILPETWKLYIFKHNCVT